MFVLLIICKIFKFLHIIFDDHHMTFTTIVYNEFIIFLDVCIIFIFQQISSKIILVLLDCFLIFKKILLITFFYAG